MHYQSKDLVLAGAFGWLCGMRSMSGPALVSRKLIKNDAVVAAFGVGAVGEMLADKHPEMPNRTDPAPLMGRVLLGAATGAAILLSGVGSSRRVPLRSRRFRWPRSDADAAAAVAIGGLIGGATAYLSTHVCYQVRKSLSEKADAPQNLALGAAEDAITYGAGLILANEL